MIKVSKTGVIVGIVIVIVGIAFVALHFLNDLVECESRCIEAYIFSKFCGKLVIDSNETYHTFTRCEFKCHAARNPNRAFEKISDLGNSCKMLGFPEEYMEEPNEYIFPYINPKEMSVRPNNKTA